MRLWVNGQPVMRDYLTQTERQAMAAIARGRTFRLGQYVRLRRWRDMVVVRISGEAVTAGRPLPHLLTMFLVTLDRAIFSPVDPGSA